MTDAHKTIQNNNDYNTYPSKSLVLALRKDMKGRSNPPKKLFGVPLKYTFPPTTLIFLNKFQIILICT